MFARLTFAPQVWERFHVFWLSTGVPVHVARYEDLLSRAEETLAGIVAFLHVSRPQGTGGVVARFPLPLPLCELEFVRHVLCACCSGKEGEECAVVARSTLVETPPGVAVSLYTAVSSLVQVAV